MKRWLLCTYLQQVSICALNNLNIKHFNHPLYYSQAILGLRTIYSGRRSLLLLLTGNQGGL